MKKRKRLLSILLTAVLIICCMTALTYAAGGKHLPFDGYGDQEVTYYNDDNIPQTAYRTSGGFAYTLVNSDGLDTVRIVGYNGTSNVMKVPEKINGHVVSGFSIDPEKPIENETYDRITEIDLPDSVIYLRTRNLEKFKGLRSISGANGQEFDNAKYKTADGVLYKKKSDNKLKIVHYPAGKRDKSWTAADWVCGRIDFSNQYLETLNVDSVEVNRIYLSDLTGLKSVTVTKDNKYYSTIDGVLYDREGECLLQYPAGRTEKEFHLPDSAVGGIDDGSVCGDLEKNKVETLYLPSDINLRDFTWYGVLEFYNLKKVVFTGKKAPVLNRDNLWGFNDFYTNAQEKGIEFAWPDDGEGYEDFFADISWKGWLPAPKKFVELSLGKSETVTIEPGETVAFEFTAPKRYRYSALLNSSETFSYYSCAMNENQEYYHEEPTWVEQLYQYSLGGTYSGTVYFEGSLAGEKNYLQIRSAETERKCTITVSLQESGPIGLAELPASCKEIELRDGKGSVSGTTTTSEEVVTYSFRTADAVPGTYCRDNASFTIKRSSEHEQQIWFGSAIICEENHTWFSVNNVSDQYDDEITNQFPMFLNSGTKYYIQLQPGVVGDFSINIDINREIYNDDDDDDDDDYEPDYRFAAVPTGGVEGIKVNDQKTVTSDKGDETFTYKFTPEVTGNYTFASVGSSDTVGRVLGEDRETVLGVDDDSSYYGKRDFAVHFHAEAGVTYYLQAKMYDEEDKGTFTLTLTDYIGEHKHELTYHPAVAGTPEKDGTRAYYECTVCGKLFADESCRKRLYADDLTVEYGELITGFGFSSVNDLTGNVGEDSVLDAVYQEGNKFTAAMDDGSSRDYKYAKYDGDCVGFFLDGDTEKEDISGSLTFRIRTDDGLLAAGENVVTITARINGQYVSTDVKVVCEDTSHEHVAGDPVHENEVAATCTKNGSYDEVTYCTECSKEMSRKTITTDKAPHTWNDGVVTKQPTCTQTGEKTFTCTECGAEKPEKETVAATGHSWDQAKYEWSDDYMKVTASHSCTNENHNADLDGPVTETEETAPVAETITAPTLKEGGQVLYTANFIKEDFATQTKKVEIPALTVEQALEQVRAAVKDAEDANGVSSKTDATSTDDSDAMDAREKAQAAVNQAQILADAFGETYKEAKKLLERAQKALEEALAGQVSASEESLDASSGIMSSEEVATEVKATDEEIEQLRQDVADAQRAVDDAMLNVVAAKRELASANSELAAAMASSAKVASNQAAAAEKAAANAPSSAEAEKYRRQAAEAADAAKAMAGRAEAASGEVSQIASDLTELANETENDDVKNAISEASGAVAEKAESAESSANAAEKASGNAEESGNNAGAAADSKAEQERAAAEAAKTAAGTVHMVGGSTIRILEPASGAASGKAAFVKAKNAKSVTVPATVPLYGKTFEITQIDANAFKGTKAKTVTIKSMKLTKASVRKCLSGSKVKTVKVKVGNKKQNKKFLKKYKKLFTKKIAGRKVAVK